MPRIAIASSGLGHIPRGVESWANDLAVALHERLGDDVSLFQGAGQPAESWRHVLPCWRRCGPGMQAFTAVTRTMGGWRYGCGSAYEAEQTTFSLPLWWAIRNKFDILHVQDPILARWLDLFRQKGLARARVILAHGTEEEPAFLSRYPYLQHLAPCYLEAWEAHRPAGQLSFAVPNFVDTRTFCPGDRDSARAAWGLPKDAFIVLSVAALKRTHKRCDYLMREFAAFRAQFRGPALLVVAGAVEAETAGVLELGRSLLGDSLVVHQALERSRLPALYRAADVFSLASLHEMMPIAVLEAMASGLPVCCNRTPVLTWIAGPGGALRDISQAGGLVGQWQRLMNPEVHAAAAAAARERALAAFSPSVVVGQVLAMYDQVLAA